MSEGRTFVQRQACPPGEPFTLDAFADVVGKPMPGTAGRGPVVRAVEIEHGGGYARFTVDLPPDPPSLRIAGRPVGGRE